MRINWKIVKLEGVRCFLFWEFYKLRVSLFVRLLEMLKGLFWVFGGIFLFLMNLISMLLLVLLMLEIDFEFEFN